MDAIGGKPAYGAVQARSTGGPAMILFLITPGRLDEFFRRRDELSDPAEVVAHIREFF